MSTDLDVEMALMALSARDMGEPTEDLDLATLSPVEKKLLLEMLHKRLLGGDIRNPDLLDDDDAGAEEPTAR